MSAAVRHIIGPTILTADGIYFDFEAPQPETITLNAIARGLANTCRFGGQCTTFYSVAEHSVLLSEIVSPDHAIAGLLHDAAEAFVGDMPKPLKVILPDYQAVEARVEAVVLAKFGLSGLPPEIKHADMRMLAAEQQQLMRNHDDWTWTGLVEPAAVDLRTPLGPDAAFERFMARAGELGLIEEID